MVAPPSRSSSSPPQFRPTAPSTAPRRHAHEPLSTSACGHLGQKGPEPAACFVSQRRAAKPAGLGPSIASSSAIPQAAQSMAPKGYPAVPAYGYLISACQHLQTVLWCASAFAPVVVVAWGSAALWLGSITGPTAGMALVLIAGLSWGLSGLMLGIDPHYWVRRPSIRRHDPHAVALLYEGHNPKSDSGTEPGTAL